ncbi:glycosyltransferase [Pediococcus parvulus]|uniref:glycosyltransferase n=1 Tax=Pediococcus parvulus TaxID=54062 RepID=UPI0021A4AA57|nr:glycosyltransferase [Pediococcus parvulus]MCT3034566.1 glycosyltransferase [Pediococcus parvulus]
MKNIFIILNYNSFLATKKLTESISDFKNIYHIVIVDNASTDEDTQRLNDLKSNKITVLFLSKNNGYAAGNNAGIRFSIRKFGLNTTLFIANPDISVTDDTVYEMSSFILKNDANKVGMVAPIMHNNRTAWRFTSLYKTIFLESGILPKFTKSFSFYDRFYAKSISHSRQKFLEVDVLAGAFFALSAKAFSEINYFDENTFLYYEEEILAIKLTSKKYSNYLLMNCEYEHKHDYSTDTNKVRKVKIMNQSRKYFFDQYFKLTKFDKKMLKLSDRENLFLAYLSDKKRNS